jgi:hypothetical protein
MHFLKYASRTSRHESSNSQLGIFSNSEKIKYPKPLNGKAFIQQCIRQLYEVFNNLNCLNTANIFSSPKLSMLHKDVCSFLQKTVMYIVYP